MINRITLKDRLKKAIKAHGYLYAIVATLIGRKPVFGGIKKNISGRKNTFEHPASAIFVNCKLDVQGNNNRIRIGELCSFTNVTFWIRGDNNKIEISRGVKFSRGGSLHMEDKDCVIAIGDDSTFEDAHLAATEPGSRIVIGDDCMFAYDIDVRTGDSHSIIDTDTQKRINYARDVQIGDHVWISAHCSILKGVAIPMNSVVATRSVVTKAFDQNGVIIGGNPSRVLKEHITWRRQRIYHHSDDGPVYQARRTSANGSEFIHL